MTTFTVKTSIGGGKVIVSDTENVASFGAGPQGQTAYWLWLKGMAQFSRDSETQKITVIHVDLRAVGSVDQFA
jgi:hypothetical protein